jgi:SAM-dependent methyltransferase
MAEPEVSGESSEAAGAPSMPAAPPPPGTAAWLDVVTRLHAALLASGYAAIERIPTVRNLFALPVEPWNLWAFASGRGGRRLLQASVAPEFYRRLTRLRDPDLERRFAFFFLGDALAADEVARLLTRLPGAPDLSTLRAEGVVTAVADGRVRARLRFLPAGGLLVVTDPHDRSIPDFTWLGRDSLVFAERLRVALTGRRFARALDLCCGTGVQGLTVVGYAERVEGTDVNARAVAFANLNAGLAGLGDRVRFTIGNLADGLTGPYDLVVANPPYVWLPKEDAASNRDGYGGELGLEVVGRILADLDRLLAPHGEAHLICDSPVIAGESALTGLAERLLASARLGVVLTPLRYMVYRQLARFHRAHGVEYVRYCHVRVSRDLPVGVHEQRMPLLKRVLNHAFVRIARPLYERAAAPAVPP